MSLSSILVKDTPKYDLTVPSTRKKIKYRPFLVKEEKILLIAQESDDIDQIYSSIVDVIESCAEGFEDVKTMPLFDVEYIFLQLRAKSIGEVVQPTVVCPDTGEHIQLDVNITSIEVVVDPNQNKNIQISDDIVVKMNYPTVLDVIENSKDNSNLYDMVISCMDEIQNNKEVFECGDFSREELEDFVNHLTAEQFSKLLNFVLESPKLEHEVSYTTSDGIERGLVLSGLGDFFL